MATTEDVDEDAVLCGVCNSEFDDRQRTPQLLPCLHTLCRDCALNAAKGSLLTCGLCQEVHTIGADLALLTDSTMKNMVDVVRIQRKSGSILCSDCPDNNKGEKFCRDCYVFLCSECTSAHKRTQLTRKHAVLSIEELKTSGIDSFSRKEMCQMEGHGDQPFSYFCDNPECQKPVCTQCVLGDHSQAGGHVIRNLGEVYEENKIHVERLVGEVLSKLSVISSDAKQQENESKVIDEKEAKVTAEVDSVFDELEAILKKRRAQLKERVSVICQERKSSLDSELSKLKKNKTEMENACNYSSRMLVFTNKPEFLNLFPTVTSRLSSLLNAVHDVTSQDKFELTFETGPDRAKLEEICTDVGEIRTNVYGGPDGTPSHPVRINGTVDVEETFVLPYKGPPIHPPGTFTLGRHGTPDRAVKEVRLPKVEPLNFDSITKDQNSYKMPTKTGLKSTPSPEAETVLGRPLALRSPVIAPAHKSTSLGDFLNGRSFQLVIRCQSTPTKKEAQDNIDREQERHLPKAPNSPQITSSVRSGPTTSPSLPSRGPLSLNQTLPSSFGSGSSYVSKGYDNSPPSRDVTSPLTSSSKYGGSYLHNGPEKVPMMSNCSTSPLRRIANRPRDPTIPRLDLSTVAPITSTLARGDIKGVTRPGNISPDRRPDVPASELQEASERQNRSVTSTNGTSLSRPKLGVTWKDGGRTGEAGRLTNFSENKPTTLGIASKLTESSYPDVKAPSPRKQQSPGDRPVVFGDISCPDFQMDPNSAHHEREVTSDGRTLRNKKTDIFGGGPDLDNSLVQYKGAIGTLGVKEQGKVYWELDVVYNIQQPLEETWLVFEIGLCRLDDIDMHHTVERHEHARSFYVARYPETGKLTQEFWHNRELLEFSPLSDNSPGIEVRITYGLFVDTRKRKWVIVDCNNNKVLHSFDMLDFSEALYPVFGCYNPDLCTVEMTLKTGNEITIVPQCLKSPGFRSP
ncbi:uncharacterized protein LOC128220813 isoform X2 [Mya arenaria]|uniref:uncharacterized protein LOC128220813 isoform X2 n=1 Tax=Mya arenaria TaxID=6604 RepID=UPI0022E707B2|nr:uncharacterized protein LOC128220813 isoform X2 [Mya arenaria]